MSGLRGGVFGCGMISEFHLRAWRRIPAVEIVALGDLLLERADERRAQFSLAARVYSDLSVMLERERLDFLDILTPPALHLEHCLLAKGAGVHIICQKPLCDDLDDARQLVAAMQDSQRIFVVHENHRYRPWFQRILQWQASGLFGPVHLVRLDHLNATAPAESYKLAGQQGILLEYGTHLVDMMIALFGAPDRVYARTHRLNPDVQGESLAHVVYEYADATVEIDVGWKRAGLLQGGALVQGECGEAYYEGTMTRGAASRFRVVQGSEVIADETRSPDDDYAESFYLFQRDCVEAMLGRTLAPQPAAENLRTLACAFAAYESARSGRVVSL